MNAEEAAHYLHQISRKAKAKAMPPTMLEGNPKWKDTYDRINEYLRQNYKSYLLWYVSGGTYHLSESILKAACEAAEKAEVFKKLNAALTAGDIEEFDFNCFLLKLLYRLKEHESAFERRSENVGQDHCELRGCRGKETDSSLAEAFA